MLAGMPSNSTLTSPLLMRCWTAAVVFRGESTIMVPFAGVVRNARSRPHGHDANQRSPGRQDTVLEETVVVLGQDRACTRVAGVALLVDRHRLRARVAMADPALMRPVRLVAVGRP